MESIFATPSALWAGLLIGPLLLLFMLKHKPVRRRMPSVVLWQGAAQMQVSTSPFQRLRKSLSLILLLCALIALVLALAGLRIPGARARGTHIVLVIDVTAGMGARDIGGTRIELARLRALELLDSTGDAPVTVLAWDGIMRPATSPQTTTARARQAVSELSPVDYGASDGALVRALRRIREEPGERRIVLVSGHDPGSLDEGVVFVAVGSPQPNTALVAAALTEVSAGQQELFFGVEHFGPQAIKASLLIERVQAQGEPDLVDARELDLVPGARASVTLPVREPGLYRARLRSPDTLELDNTAWVRFSRLPVQDVALVGEVPEPLRRAIAAMQEATGAVRVVAAPGNETMNVYASGAQGAAPVLPAVYLLPQSAPVGVTVSTTQPAAQAPARPARHALWRGAGVPDIRIAEVLPVSSARLVQPLLETAPGPALALLRRDDESRVDDLLVCFALDDDAGGFASRVAFVIFWENWFDAGRRLRDPLPRGSVSTRDSTDVPWLAGRGPFRYGLTGQPERAEGRPGESLRLEVAGVYEFEELSGPEPRELGASLLDADESNLGAASTEPYDPGLVAELLAAQDKEGARADLPLYPWLALLAAVLVLFEWYWFRRNYPVNAAEPAKRRTNTA